MTQIGILRFATPVMMMWLLMAVEQPIIAASVARLPDPETNLAAFGLAFSVALIIESPVIMLLMAGTALARDSRSYRLLWRFSVVLAVLVTVVHLLVALTPLYDVLMRDVVGAPEAVIAPGRQALALMFAWSAAIAFRRLWQGVMIRFDQTTRAGLTTVVRVVVLVGVCAVGVYTASLAGAALGATALNLAVLASAAAAFLFVRPTLREHLTLPSSGSGASPRTVRSALTLASLLRFYVPLALTSLILLGGQPVLSVGLSQSSDAVASLAVWPVVLGLLFVLRSPGYAYQEVAVALLERPRTRRPLVRFTWALALVLSVLLALVALTPLAHVWLSRVSGLTDELASIARLPLVVLIPAPALTVAAAWGRACLVQQDRTPVITQAVAANLVVLALSMALGLRWLGGSVSGAGLAAAALVLSLVAETLWLRWKLRRPFAGPEPASSPSAT